MLAGRDRQTSSSPGGAGLVRDEFITLPMDGPDPAGIQFPVGHEAAGRAERCALDPHGEKARLRIPTKASPLRNEKIRSERGDAACQAAILTDPRSRGRPSGAADCIVISSFLSPQVGHGRPTLA